MNAQQAIARLDWIHAERQRLRALPIEVHQGLGQRNPDANCSTCAFKFYTAYEPPCIRCARTEHFPDWTPE